MQCFNITNELQEKYIYIITQWCQTYGLRTRIGLGRTLMWMSLENKEYILTFKLHIQDFIFLQLFLLIKTFPHSHTYYSNEATDKSLNDSKVPFFPQSTCLFFLRLHRK